MRNWIETTGKTVEDALLEAKIQLNTTEENIDYEVIEEPSSSGLFGLNKKPAVIRAAVKETIKDKAVNFISDILNVMGIENEVKCTYDEAEKTMNFELVGSDMGILIGKRGQTLDSLQYLVSLVVNKDSDEYIKVKIDTENYRERRKETLENLAKNISSKIRKTGKPVSLEPMNPYERRIIHSALQDDKYVETHSEGDEPYRKVVITLKKGVKVYNKYNDSKYGRHGSYGKRDGRGTKSTYKKPGYHRNPDEVYRYGNIEEGEVYEGVKATVGPDEQ